MPPPEPQLERFIPLTEAAQYFAREYPWLLAQCHTGVFEHHKVGRNYFMTPTQIRSAQEKSRVPATSDGPTPQHRPNTRGPHTFDHLLARRR